FSLLNSYLRPSLCSSLVHSVPEVPEARLTRPSGRSTPSHPREADDCGFVAATPAQRLAQVWVLTREISPCAGIKNPDQRMRRREVAVLLRRGGSDLRPGAAYALARPATRLADHAPAANYRPSSCSGERAARGTRSRSRTGCSGSPRSMLSANTPR